MPKPRQGTHIGEVGATEVKVCQLCEPRQGCDISDVVATEVKKLQLLEVFNESDVGDITVAEDKPPHILHVPLGWFRLPRHVGWSITGGDDGPDGQSSARAIVADAENANVQA